MKPPETQQMKVFCFFFTKKKPLLYSQVLKPPHLHRMIPLDPPALAGGEGGAPLAGGAGAEEVGCGSGRAFGEAGGLFLVLEGFEAGEIDGAVEACGVGGSAEEADDVGEAVGGVGEEVFVAEDEEFGVGVGGP